MAHHAYFIAGDAEEGIADALTFIASKLGLPATHSDVLVLRYDNFSVDDARAVAETASRAPIQGDVRALVISAKRFFHEAQNALLKTFEEPAPGVHLFLVVSSSGVISPTLHSRLLPLAPSGKGARSKGEEFLNGSEADREKIVEKILARAKKDAPAEKQAARVEALELAQEVMRAGYKDRAKNPALAALLSDLDRLIPILHERSAPLKPVLEHLLIAAKEI